MITRSSSMAALGIENLAKPTSTQTPLVVTAPAIASTTVNSEAIDSQADAAKFNGYLRCVIGVPALTSTQLPNGATLTLTLQASNDPLFGSGITQIDQLILTGAGGVGAPAQVLVVPIPSNSKRYLRLVVASGVGTVLGAVPISFSLGV